MKLNIKWFAVSSTITVSFFFAIIFIWCAVNGFGADLVRIFESIHPNGGFSIIENFNEGILIKSTGVAINILYIAVDVFIITFAFASLYNFFVNRSEK